jgi:hypothetical protein
LKSNSLLFNFSICASRSSISFILMIFSKLLKK